MNFIPIIIDKVEAAILKDSLENLLESLDESVGSEIVTKIKNLQEKISITENLFEDDINPDEQNLNFEPWDK